MESVELAKLTVTNTGKEAVETGGGVVAGAGGRAMGSASEGSRQVVTHVARWGGGYRNIGLLASRQQHGQY